MSKKTVKKLPDATPSSQIEYAVLHDINMSRDQIKGGLKNDLMGAYLTLSEVLSNNDVLEAFTEVMWQKYKKLHENSSQTKLKLDDKS